MSTPNFIISVEYFFMSTMIEKCTRVRVWVLQTLSFQLSIFSWVRLQKSVLEYEYEYDNSVMQ